MAVALKGMSLSSSSLFSIDETTGMISIRFLAKLLSFASGCRALKSLKSKSLVSYIIPDIFSSINSSTVLVCKKLGIFENSGPIIRCFSPASFEISLK